MDPGITEEHISHFLFSAMFIVRDGNAKLDLMIQVRMSRFQDISLFKEDKVIVVKDKVGGAPRVSSGTCL